MIFVKIDKCHRVIPCNNGVILLYKENKHDNLEKGIHINNENCNKLHQILEIKENDKS